MFPNKDAANLLFLAGKKHKKYSSTFAFGATSEGTRNYDSTQLRFSKATNISPGIDDFSQIAPFALYKVVVMPDGNGKPQKVAYEGTTAFDTHVANREGDVFTMFSGAFFRRIKEGLSEQFILSPDDLTNAGFILHPNFFRGGKIYKEVGISSYMLGENGANIQSMPGLPVRVNIPWTSFNTAMRAKGLYVMDYAAASYLQVLGSIKYNNLNWQAVIGQGVSNTYTGDGSTAAEKATASETAVKRIIVTNTHAAKFAVGDSVTLTTGTFFQSKITAIDTYDASNKAITINAPATFNTIAATTGIRRSVNWTGETDSVLGTCGMPIGTDGKTSVKTLGIENFYSNAWDLLGGAFRYCNTVTPVDELYTNNDVVGVTGWPATPEAALAAGWSKMAGSLPTGNGYIQSFNYDPDASWNLMTKTIGGTSAYPVGDYYATAMTTGQYIDQFGGSLGYGSNVGPCYSYLGGGLGAADWGYGAFGLYLPAD